MAYSQKPLKDVTMFREKLKEGYWDDYVYLIIRLCMVSPCFMNLVLDTEWLKFGDLCLGDLRFLMISSLLFSFHLSCLAIDTIGENKSRKAKHKTREKLTGKHSICKTVKHETCRHL